MRRAKRGIDIRDPIYEIANALGLEPNNVREITFRPGRATAIVYLLNDRGSKYVDPTTDDAATETLEFEVAT